MLASGLIAAMTPAASLGFCRNDLRRTLRLDDRVEYLGVLVFGWVSVRVDDEILLSMVRCLKRCAWFDMDKATSR